ncbi:ABC transporter permease [Bradyrhizobium oligotrophicum S58]|uniref:ABC transporter permease n=1 Tax=Bradyrhizobium oligotrophicum S58 TaxID=1245469 RepID=M4ZL03_9BRAD|nr:ABC transporter permease [Bradyrhizobium oligotrophicum S58]
MIKPKGHMRLFATTSVRQYSPSFSLALIAPLILLLVFSFVYPVGRLLWTSVATPNGVTAEHYLRIWYQPLYLTILGRTIQLAFVVTVTAFLLAFPVAYAMTLVKKRWVAVMTICVLIPLWTSVLVRSYSWIVLLQRNGIVNNLLREIGVVTDPLRMIYTEGSVMVAMTHGLLPFMILPIYSALDTIPPELAKAARNLGAGPVQAFLRITLPLSLPGIYAGSLMTFILALGFYITPALVGGPQTLMMATLIGQQTTDLLNWPFAAALSGVLLAATLLLVAVFRKALALNKGGQFG